MTAVEDRTRAAMDAITGLVERVPPLPLPPPPGAVPGRRRRVPLPRRRWGAWLAPVTAAAAVVAIAIALVAVRDMPGGQPTATPGPVTAAAGLPGYEVALNQSWTDTTSASRPGAHRHPDREEAVHAAAAARPELRRDHRGGRRPHVRRRCPSGSVRRRGLSGAVADLVPGAHRRRRPAGLPDDDEAADPADAGRHRHQRDRAVP